MMGGMSWKEESLLIEIKMQRVMGYMWGMAVSGDWLDHLMGGGSNEAGGWAERLGPSPSSP